MIALRKAEFFQVNQTHAGASTDRNMQGRVMTTISKDRTLVTFINVFTVTPANQPRLIELLTEVTGDYVRRAPGFISSSLHRSLDGTKVTMYAQWQSLADYDAMRKDPGPFPYLQEALTIAKFEPGMYEVVASFRPLLEDL